MEARDGSRCSVAGLGQSVVLGAFDSGLPKVPSRFVVGGPRGNSVQRGSYRPALLQARFSPGEFFLEVLYS
jgi:hypothetical protein